MFKPENKLDYGKIEGLFQLMEKYNIIGFDYDGTSDAARITRGQNFEPQLSPAESLALDGYRIPSDSELMGLEPDDEQPRKAK